MFSLILQASPTTTNALLGLVLNKMTDGNPLEELRRDIDRIDDTLQELLWQRAAVVEKIRAYKHKQRAFRRGGFFRPSREIEILRRLLRRHQGRFPKLGIVEIWRTIIASHLAHQEHFSLAVYRPKTKDGCWELAREHYGSIVPMTAESSVTSVLKKVSERTASAGVLPVPCKKEDAWWRHLAGRFEDLQIVAGLPFVDFENGEGKTQALLVAPIPAEPSSKDRSFFMVVTAGGIGPARLAAAFAGEKIKSRSVFTWRGSASARQRFSLIEAEGFFGEADPVLLRVQKRLGAQAKRVAILGSYAVPLDGGKRQQGRKPSRVRT